MALDTSGVFLEEVRAGTGNNPFTFPPRNSVTDQAEFDSTTLRAEYCLLVSSADPYKASLDLADPDLRFKWIKNQSRVSRFSYDNFSNRWTPSPGGPPDQIGSLSNDPRLSIPVPDLLVADAPFDVWVGNPARSVTFSLSFVKDQSEFSDPSSIPSGTLEVSALDGKLNFGKTDLDLIGGQTVFSSRQSFFDRSSVTGSIGTIPVDPSLPSSFVMNPRPALTQREREVVAHLSTGMTDGAIGQSLGISRKTVDAHMVSIRNKLGCDNRVKVVRLALQGAIPGLDQATIDGSQ